jgi:acyl-CoA thioesterase
MSSDLEFLGLVADGEPGRYRFTVQNHLARLDARLYGGTAIAVSLAAAELVSERAPLWMTTQFVSTAPAEAEIAVHAEVLAPGRRTNQVRVTATDAAGEIMFASLGATGRPREEGLTGTFEHPPVVTPPAESGATGGPFTTMPATPASPTCRRCRRASASRRSSSSASPRSSHPDPGPGRICMWVRARTRCRSPGDRRVHRRHGAAVGRPRRRPVAGGISLTTPSARRSEPTEGCWSTCAPTSPPAATATEPHSCGASRAGCSARPARPPMFEFDLANAPWSGR